jgi:hypothetical protein
MKMNKIIRLSIATFVAVVVALSINFVVSAVTGPYTITESPLYYVWGVTGAPPVPLYNSACLGGSCMYRIGSTSSVNAYAWASTGRPHTYQIWAYDPTIGESVAKYAWYETAGGYSTTVNQAASWNKGQWVYLGFSDHVTTNNGGYLMLNNDCTGWTCGKKVLFDSMRYNTNP